MSTETLPPPPIKQLRGRVATTPERLRVAMVIVVAALLAAGLVAIGATAARRSAAEAVALRDEPVMAQAAELYATLADADATAAATFLAGGRESPVRRQRYLSGVRRASLQLNALSQRVQDSPAAARAIAAIAASLPIYTGLVESARANNRQRFPVGAAYLRDASNLMRGRILASAGDLYRLQSRRLNGHQAEATRSGGLTSPLLALALAVVALIGAQALLARRTRRVFNVRLVAATALAVVIGAWFTIAMVRAANAGVTAQRMGSDSVQVLSAARILALRAQADESLALVARGGGDQYLTDFGAVARTLDPRMGLLAEAARLERRTGSDKALAPLIAGWRRFLAAHTRVAALQAGGDFSGAINAAIGPSAPADGANRELAARIAAAQRRFDRSAADATSALAGVVVGIALLIALAAGLAVWGLQQRIGEYR
jgi:hypothetical protein